MFKMKLIFFFTILLSIFARITKSQCILPLENSTEKKPLIERNFGKIKLKILYASEAKDMQLYENEIVTGYCRTGISHIPGFYVKRNYVSFRCTGGEVFLHDSYSYHYSYRSQLQAIDKSYKFSCNDLEWIIYDTKRPLPWCSTQASSYILGTNNLKPNMILGALCYNLQKRTLESLHFSPAGKDFKFTQDERQNLNYPSDLSRLQLLGESITGFKSIFHGINNNQGHQIIDPENSLLTAIDYEYDSIVQNGFDDEILKNFEKFLEISWWPNLRKGNWKRFMQAFDRRLAEVQYDVYLGTSGNLQIPIQNEENDFEFKTYNSSTPAYIWAHLHAKDNSDDFVFISYNSPFFEFFNSTDIIFCKDICKNISWLNKVRASFRFSILGVSFCCTPEDVISSMTLNHFPKAYESLDMIAESDETSEMIFEPDETTEMVYESDEASGFYTTPDYFEVTSPVIWWNEYDDGYGK